MTVIAGVRLAPDGQVLLVADRVVVNPTWEVAEVIPAMLGDRDKLFARPGGAAVALAGIAGGEGAADLLTDVADLVASPGTPRRIGYELLELFTQVASAVRSAPAAAGAAAVIEPFEVPVLAAALIAAPAPAVLCWTPWDSPLRGRACSAR